MTVTVEVNNWLAGALVVGFMAPAVIASVAGGVGLWVAAETAVYRTIRHARHLKQLFSK